jgi:hypothetical protein
MTAFYPPLKLAQYGAYDIPLPVQFKTRTGQPVPFLASPQPYPARFVGREKFGATGAPIAKIATMKPKTPYMTTGQPVRDVYGLQGFGNDGFTESVVPMSEIFGSGGAQTNQLEELARKWTQEDSGWADSLGKKALAILVNFHIAEINAYTLNSYAQTLLMETDKFSGMSFEQAIVAMVGTSGRDNMKFVIERTGQLRRELNKWRGQLSMLPDEWKRVLFMFLDLDRTKYQYGQFETGFGGGGALAILILIAIIILILGVGAIGVLQSLPETMSQANAREAEAQAARAKSEADTLEGAKILLDYGDETGDPELKEIVKNRLKKMNERLVAETEAATEVARAAGVSMSWWQKVPGIQTLGKGVAIIGIAYFGTMYLTSGSFSRMWSRVKGHWGIVRRKPKTVSPEQEYKSAIADIEKRKGIARGKHKIAVGESDIRALERETARITKPGKGRSKSISFRAFKGK